MKETVAALFACFSWTAHYYVLACGGDPLNGWYISVPGACQSAGTSHGCGLLRGIKQGHSLGLALRVVTVPGVTHRRMGSSPNTKGKRRDCKSPEPVAAFPCWASWWAVPSGLTTM
ncbi:hypothetical protein AVEN_191380-1 [Araneus ventricosus]|uniref:Uncharacterized protein n=1 Tax=Araneus ventricosus TaxID=182803 RepID=A0A4Y2EA72_ARAVE|nr:hypothetical protein AVEN_191380-1 [Araneus ventricosus]